MNKNLILGLSSASMIAMTLLGSFSASAQSNEPQWWFNVELIVFKRDLLPSNTESFGPAIDLNSPQKDAKQAQHYSSNFLYLAALKNTSQNADFSQALPICGNNENVDDAFRLPSHALFTANSALANSNGNKQPDNPRIQRSIKTKRVELLDEQYAQSLSQPFNIQETLNQSSMLNETQVTAASRSSKEAVLNLTNKVIEIRHNLHAIANTQMLMSCVNEHIQTPLSQFSLSSIGPRLFSENSYFQGRKQLLAQTDLALEAFAKNVFAQRDITPVLYTAWRQEVEFGIENAEFMRVRAGDLLESSYTPSYEQWEKTYISPVTRSVQSNDEQFFETLKKNIEDDQTIDWLSAESRQQDTNENTFAIEKQYEIDGKIKVYLDYVNQVPYLHVDTAFNRFSLVVDSEGSRLTAFPSTQRRRIISKQIHYFDHPAFGVIVRLERFTPPPVQEVQENKDSEESEDSEKKYMKIYTKQGDKGTTAVYTSTVTRMDKDDILLDCYGTLDELNSYLGLCASGLREKALSAHKETLMTCQQQLFAIGFALSDSDKLQASSITQLEASIDELQKNLPPQTSFILPGGSASASHLHVARTIARRAERRLVSVAKHYTVNDISLAYVNRLSDYLFVLARHCNHIAGIADTEV